MALRHIYGIRILEAFALKVIDTPGLPVECAQYIAALHKNFVSGIVEDSEGIANDNLPAHAVPPL